VLLPGFRTDVLGCLKSFDLFVMSSVTEGLGTSLLDAMAARDDRGDAGRNSGSSRTA
jgi:glycosyltransferase involved in cell wall biosynthesis